MILPNTVVKERSTRHSDYIVLYREIIGSFLLFFKISFASRDINTYKTSGLNADRQNISPIETRRLNSISNEYINLFKAMHLIQQ